MSATGTARLTPVGVKDDHLVGGGEVEADSSGLGADEQDEVIAIRILEAIDHVHPLVLVGLPGEDVKGEAGHRGQTVRRGCSLDVEMNSATILSSRTEFENISTA